MHLYKAVWIIVILKHRLYFNLIKQVANACLKALRVADIRLAVYKDVLERRSIIGRKYRDYRGREAWEKPGKTFPQGN